MVKRIKHLGPYAFFAGFAISVIASFMWPSNLPATLAVLLLGVVVGLLNIQPKEVPNFLIAAIAFTASAAFLGVVFGQFPVISSAAPRFFDYIVTFVAPATGVVAFKQIWMLAKD